MLETDQVDFIYSIPSEHFERLEDLGYEYDLDASRELVEANDFGNEEVTIMVPTQDNYRVMGEYIHSKMDEAGFNVSIERVEWGTYLELTADANYDMTLLGWSNLTADGSVLFYPTLHSDNIGASNRAQFNNSEFDQLVEDSRVIIDEDERMQLLAEANELVINEAAWIPLHHSSNSIAFKNHVEDLNIDPSGTIWLYEVSITDN